MGSYEWSVAAGGAVATLLLLGLRRSLRSLPEAPAPAPSPPTTAQPMGGRPEVAAATARKREAWIRAHVVRLTEETFPDDVGVEPVIQTFEHRERLSLVEVEPQPPALGYARFRYVISFSESEPRLIAVYCLEGGRFQLLCSDPQPGEPLERVLA